MLLPVLLVAAIAAEEPTATPDEPRAHSVFVDLAGGWGIGYGLYLLESVNLDSDPVYISPGAGWKGSLEVGWRWTPRLALVIGSGLSWQRAKFQFDTDFLQGQSIDSNTGASTFTEVVGIRKWEALIAYVPLTLGIRLAAPRSLGGRLEPYVGAGAGYYWPRVFRDTLEQNGELYQYQSDSSGTTLQQDRRFVRRDDTVVTMAAGYGFYGRAGATWQLGRGLALRGEVRYTHLVFLVQRSETVYNQTQVDPATGNVYVTYGTNVTEYGSSFPPPNPAAQQVSNGTVTWFDNGRTYWRNEQVSSGPVSVVRYDTRSRQVGIPILSSSSVDLTLGAEYSF